MTDAVLFAMSPPDQVVNISPPTADIDVNLITGLVIVVALSALSAFFAFVYGKGWVKNTIVTVSVVTLAFAFIAVIYFLDAPEAENTDPEGNIAHNVMRSLERGYDVVDVNKDATKAEVGYDFAETCTVTIRHNADDPADVTSVKLEWEEDCKPKTYREEKIEEAVRGAHQ